MPDFTADCVRAAFEDNFASGKEIGAHFAVYRDGVPLVDLWGGSADESGSVPDRTLYTLMWESSTTRLPGDFTGLNSPPRASRG